MFRITVAAITAMLLGSPARAGDAAPALGLTLQLTAAPVFVGEMPLLRMALTRPSQISEKCGGRAGLAGAPARIWGASGV